MPSYFVPSYTIQALCIYLEETGMPRFAITTVLRMPVRSFEYFYTHSATRGPSTGIVSILIPTTMARLLANKNIQGIPIMQVYPSIRVRVCTCIVRSQVIIHIWAGRSLPIQTSTRERNIDQ